MRKITSFRIILLSFSFLLFSASAFAGFAPPVIYQAGNGPNCIAVEDFNRDGNIDIAVSNAFSNDVSVFLGNGDGTLQPAVNYAVGNSPGCVTQVFDRVGFTDLAVTNTLDNTVSVLLNNGDGTFQPAVSYGLGTGTSPVGVLTFDANGDGLYDLAVANSAGGTNNAGNIAMLLAVGDGTFQPAVNYGTGGTQPISLASDDFDLKSGQDLAVANFASNNVSVLLNDSTGKFRLSHIYRAGTSPTALAPLGTSLLVANSGSNNVTLLVLNSLGRLLHGKNFPAGEMPTSIQVSSLNSDSTLDFVTANENDDTVGVHLGLLHPPYFQKPTNYPTCSAPKFVAVAGTTHDGLLDLVVACSNGVGVMLNTGD